MNTRHTLLLATLLVSRAFAHGDGPWGMQAMEWKNDQIGQVIALAGSGRKVTVEGKECLAGGTLGFNVREPYAFNVDETIWLDIDFYLGSSEQTLRVVHDRSDVAPEKEDSSSGQIHLPAGTSQRWSHQRIPLRHARFANLGFLGTDFAILAAHPDGSATPAFTICTLSLSRTYTTPVPKSFGWVALEVLDETGRPTPARLGIYDSSGRLQLPSDEAIPLRNLGGMTRTISLDTGSRTFSLGSGTPPWPAKNRFVFYTDGHYRARLPVGDYDLIISKGPEYRMTQARLGVRANETKPIQVKLRRWTDMAARGWYSGEDHIHYARESKEDDDHLQLFTAAEDLKVANILHMGNIANTYFPQHDWQVVASDPKNSFVLAPGQEDPRTSHLGHTIQLNIKQSVRTPERYLLYHEVFEKVHAQGGLVGYAHVVDGVEPDPGYVRGMAIDVPFGLVDFAEILSLHEIGGSAWFDFLNLGYKISPTAGTDYPWGQAPGAVRNYVKIDQSFTPQAWFDALKKGRTFVTSGPMLEFSINGQDIGSELQVARGEALRIGAKAAMNPDLGALASLELIEQGEPLKVVFSGKGTPQMRLDLNIPASHGTWFVLRARSKNSGVLALTAPIYVRVDGENFWKPSAVPAIVSRLKGAMHEILGPRTAEQTEAWETQEADELYWNDAQTLLRTRITEAQARYDELIRRAAASTQGRCKCAR